MTAIVRHDDSTHAEPSSAAMPHEFDETALDETVAATDRCRWETSATIIVLVLHAAMLAWSARIHSPAWDEVGHLPAGFAHWRTGVFDLYRVNPPLVRLFATVVPLLGGYAPEHPGYGPDCPPFQRCEFGAGRQWIAKDPHGFLGALFLARLACIPFSLVGALACRHLARCFYGPTAGLAALVLWCTSPLVLGHGSLVTPDIPSAALAVVAAVSLLAWHETPTAPRAAMAGALVGVSLLAKFTNLVLGVVAAVLLIEWLLRIAPDGLAPKRVLAHAGVLLLACLCIVNLGYAFESVGRPLGQFTFVSSLFKGSGVAEDETGNRFRGTVWGRVPVPVPANFVQGLDVQKRDFELRLPSYLRGEWQRGGWWYYYLYGAAVKEPVGILALLALSTATFACGLRESAGATLRFVLVPAVAYIMVVSSQTGFSHHLRYLLPAYPFLYVFAASLFRSSVPHWLRGMGAVALGSAVVASLSVFPHSMSYFNELVGGPLGGPRHLHNSNLDWGQDLLLLGRWAQENPAARPLRVVFSGGFDSESLPIWDSQVTHGPLTRREVDELRNGTRRNVWYAVSVGRLYDRPLDSPLTRQFRSRRPEAIVGYTIYVYRF